MASRSGCKNALSLSSRVKVIKDSGNGLLQRELANKYRCGRTQIQGVLKSQQEIISRWHQMETKT